MGGGLLFMKKLNLSVRYKHLIEWIDLILYMLKNRGTSSYGATHLRRLIERYLLEFVSTKENLIAAEKTLVEMENLLKVTHIKGLRRIGATNDGGYIGIHSESSPILISGGGGKNIEFEIELAEKGSQVKLYDPTIEKLPQEHKNVEHLKYALTSTEDKNFRKSMSLGQALQTLTLDLDEKVWLKLDIEGSEIGLLAQDLDLIPRFEQIFIEFHDTYKVVDLMYRNRLIQILRTLQESHFVVSIASNNWQGITNYGYSFAPVTFEATFLAKSSVREFSDVNEYKPLKNVNNRNRPEIPDSPFRFSPV